MGKHLNIRDRILLASLRCLPGKLAAHLMFLLKSNPAITDRWGYHVRPVHYYEPLPDFVTITPEQTQRRRESSAIRFDLLVALGAFCRRGGTLA
jgi:hypothetical protein